MELNNDENEQYIHFVEQWYKNKNVMYMVMVGEEKDKLKYNYGQERV